MKKTLTILFALLIVKNSHAVELQNSSLQDKIGQMIMVGFRGYEIDKDSSIAKQIHEGKVGGVIYFDYDLTNETHERNIKSYKQLRKLSIDLQNIKTTLPLFIAIDEEGGKVQRLKSKYGFPNEISAQKLGEINNTELTKWEALKSAKILKSMKINTNFAPVVDVNTNPDNPAIGKLERSFSENPEKVYKHAKSTIDGYKTENIITALKHFPGHGSAFNDSHLGITDITETWNSSELIPYEKLINDKKVDMIMMGHLFNKNMDDTYPASISKKYTDFIRKDMKYNGVLISDDMQMRAIRDHYSLEKQIQLFLQSDMDIILYGNNLEYDEEIADKVFNLIYKASINDIEMQKRINKSFERIIKLKNKLQ